MPLRISPCAKAGRADSGNERRYGAYAHGVAMSHVAYYIINRRGALQQVALDLARDGLGELVLEDDDARVLVGGGVLLHVPLHLFL